MFVLCFHIVSFMYIYSYLFCLYWCKDYCHRVTTQLQLIIIIIIIIINTSFLIQCKSRQLKQGPRSRYNEHGTAWPIQGSKPSRGKRFCSSPNVPDRLRGAPSLLLNGYRSSACKTSKASLLKGN